MQPEYVLYLVSLEFRAFKLEELRVGTQDRAHGWSPFNIDKVKLEIKRKNRCPRKPLLYKNLAFHRFCTAANPHDHSTSTFSLSTYNMTFIMITLYHIKIQT